MKVKPNWIHSKILAVHFWRHFRATLYVACGISYFANFPKRWTESNFYSIKSKLLAGNCTSWLWSIIWFHRSVRTRSNSNSVMKKMISVQDDYSTNLASFRAEKNWLRNKYVGVRLFSFPPTKLILCLLLPIPKIYIALVWNLRYSTTKLK